jgi:hypothetical protein
LHRVGQFCDYGLELQPREYFDMWVQVLLEADRLPVWAAFSDQCMPVANPTLIVVVSGIALAGCVAHIALKRAGAMRGFTIISGHVGD